MAKKKGPASVLGSLGISASKSGKTLRLSDSKESKRLKRRLDERGSFESRLVAAEHNRLVSAEEAPHLNLFRAVRSGDLEEVQALLLHSKADVTFRDKSYSDGVGKHATVLHLAAYLGFDHIVRFLLSIPQTDVNAQNSSGQTPLHLAVKRGGVAAVRELLRGGADSFIKDSVQRTPMSYIGKTDWKAAQQIEMFLRDPSKARKGAGPSAIQGGTGRNR